MHDYDLGPRQRQMLQLQPEEAEVLARGHGRFMLPLQLHAQHHDHVDIANRLFHVVSDANAWCEIGEFGRHQRWRPAQHNLGAELR